MRSVIHRLSRFSACSVVSLGVLAIAASLSLAQPAGEAREGGEEGRAGLRLEDLPPVVRVGVRADLVRLRAQTVPVVVIAESEGAFFAALRQWRFPVRFPVLLDDGSRRGREDIARFVRAFEPERVVRWTGPELELPEEDAELASVLDGVVAAAWGAAEGDRAGLLDRFEAIGLSPAGVVLSNAGDGARTAAVALAAARGQPILWHRMRGDFGGAFGDKRAWQIDDRVREFVEACGLSWRGLGDNVDAITVCANVPVKVRVGGGHVAFTDLLGREPPDDHERFAARDPEARAARWAYAGQVPGDAARAAYRAMCAVFLTAGAAWVWDGYADDEPWAAYDGTGAAEALERVGVRTVVDERPATGRELWRRRGRGGVGFEGGASAGRAGLVLINSHGMPEAFDLGPGTARAGEVPGLRVPAAVHLVHSWSLGRAGDAGTVGAAWLERGAFALVGSVEEPFLSAFVPTPAVAARLAGRVPWGAAVRLEPSPVWRVAVLGDPLWTVGPPGPRTAAPETLPGTSDLEAELREALSARDLARACGLLVQLGRDADAVRLYRTTVGQDELEYDASALASAALGALARAGESGLFVGAYRALPGAAQRATAERDLLWRVAGSPVDGSDESAVTLLSAHVREGNLVADARALVGPFRSLYGSESAAGFVRGLIERAADEGTREKLEALLAAQPAERSIGPAADRERAPGLQRRSLRREPDRVPARRPGGRSGGGG